MGFTPSYRAQSIFYFVVLALYTALAVFYFAFVHTRLVFTEGSNLTVANVPIYSRAGREDMGLAAEFLGFNWWVYASDYVTVAAIPSYVMAAWAFATLLEGKTMSLGYGFVMAIVIVVQLAKAIYWSVQLGFFCEFFPFCVQRAAGGTIDPGEGGNPIDTFDAPDHTFVVTVVMAWVFSLLLILLTGLSRVVKSAHLGYSQIGGRVPGARAPESIGSAIARGVSAGAPWHTPSLPRAKARR